MIVNLISLGCPKNLVDSEKILGSLSTAGVMICPSSKHSDIIIINTCGFIKPAIVETENEIKKALRLTKLGKKKIYIFGCAVNRYEKELKEKYPDISGWFKLQEREKLLNTIKTRTKNVNPNGVNTRLLTTKGYAYLKIAEGCSNHCSYCTIPDIKGPFHSFDFDTLIDEAIELSEIGAQELIIIAQETTRYGIEKYQRPMLVPLLKEISRIHKIKWIRIMYAHPKTMTPQLIEEIKTNKKICKYIDLPIQHISNRLLRLMNRGVDRSRIEDVIKELKKVKGISIRTTVIVGFPTETNDEFDELVEYAKQTSFDWLGVFPYSCEPLTEAAKLIQHPESTIQRRLHKMTAIRKQIIQKKNSQRIGKTYKTLIHYKNRYYCGHTEFAAPEIDGQIIAKNIRLDLGKFYNLKIKKMKGADLYAHTN